MNTPAHLVFAAAAFTKPDAPKLNSAVILGALIPDLSLYFMVFWNGTVKGMSAQQIFGTEYFSGFWQQVFAIDNSIPIWCLVFVLAVASRSVPAIGFASAGVLHLVLDFPLHHDDGRAHFWPFSTWIFQSPVSYWDPNHHGRLVGPLEGLAALAMLVVLWRRFHGRLARSLMVLAGLLEGVPTIVFPILFSFY